MDGTTKLHLIFKVLRNRYLPATFLNTFLQQVLVASSTYWLATATQSIGKPRDFLLSLCALGASVIVIDVIEIFGPPLCERWWRTAFARYTELFATANYGRPLLRGAAESQARAIPTLCSEAENTISTTAAFLQDLLALSLSVLLNAASIAIFVDSRFVYSYLATALIVPLSVLLTARKTVRLSAEAQNTRLSLTRMLMVGWDNISLGNLTNFRCWQNRTRHSLSNATHANVRKVTFRTRWSGAATLVSRFSLMAVLGYIAWENLESGAVLAALLTTFPRQMQILNYIDVIVRYAIDLPSHWSQWEGVLAPLQPKEESQAEHENRITWDNLRIFDPRRKESDTIRSVEDLLRFPAGRTGSRIEINGTNGCGKSTLLLLLKKHLANDAIYLPAQHSLVFERAPDEASTGEKTLAYLREIGKSPCRFLLLDEWDANLDAANISAVDQELDRLAESRWIVEIRHRRA